MSGCYDSNYNYNDCGYEQSWDDCYQPRHRRHHRRQYDNCWNYSSCS